MATKKIKVYHSGLPAATAPTDEMSVISTDGSSDKQIPLESLATYARGKLTDLDRVMDSLGSYTERPSITLTPTQTNKAISADGALVSKTGWAIAQFTAELGNEYLFKPGETSADVCVFAEKVDKVETRAIDYAYTYGTDGKVSTATATYNGKTYTYTYTYASDGSATITDSSGSVVSSLPSVYTTTVGSYQPMTRLNAGAELPSDGYCRFVSNFQAASSITVVVSYKVGSADLTMRVLRDGMTASMCTQLSKINQKVDNVTANTQNFYVTMQTTKDNVIEVDGKRVTLQARKFYRFDNPSDINIAIRDVSCDPACFGHFMFHAKEPFSLAGVNLGGWLWTPADGSAGGHGLSHITDLGDIHMLSYCDGTGFQMCRMEELETLRLGFFDFGKCTCSGKGLQCCSKLKTADLRYCDTSKLKEFWYFFSSCPALESVNISGWDTTNCISGPDCMFWGCYSLTDITFGEGFGKATASGLPLDLTHCAKAANYKLTDNTYNTLLTLYDRATAGLPTMTIKFSSKHNIPDGFVDKMTARGYTITQS